MLIMLLNYRVSNFKSIADPLLFSLIPFSENIDEKHCTTLDTNFGQWRVLQRGVLFGPNASGKSSFIESIGFAKQYITNSQHSGKSTKVNPFKGKNTEPTSFQFQIYIDGDIYEYLFSLTKIQVVNERLMQLTSSGMRTLFDRTTNDQGKTSITLYELLVENTENRLDVARLLTETIKYDQRNQLFLYKLFDNGFIKPAKVFEWFEKVRVLFPESIFQALPFHVKEDDDFRKFLSNMLQLSDTGVNNIKTEDNHIDFYEWAKKLNLPQELIDELEGKDDAIFSFNGVCYILSKTDLHDVAALKIKFSHELLGLNYDFNLQDESEGTRRLLDLFPILFGVSHEPTIFFVDELDRSLHTKLVKMFVNQFTQRNRDGMSQLIFTAHDINLLSSDTLIKDEVWFIDKKNSGITDLFPLTDFDISDDETRVTDYLSGRFGAVPNFIGDDCRG